MKSHRKIKKNDILSEFSSRIKKVFIEVPGYAYFHGPSETNNFDRRFIGRKKIIDKLVGLLNNSDTVSGAYLVTGFKGVGKSSFVSKAIEKISSFKKKRFDLRRFFKTSLFALIVCLFNIKEIPLFVFNITSVIWILLLSVLYTYCENRTDAKIKFNSIKIFLYDLFILRQSNRTSRDFKALEILRDLFILVTFFIILYLFQNICPVFSYDTVQKSLTIQSSLIIFIYFFIFLRIVNWLRLSHPVTLWKQEAKKNEDTYEYHKTCSIIKEFLLRFFDRYLKINKHVIKLNLGYDNLQELDVLKLISSGLKSEYKEICRYSRSFLPISIIYILIIYSLAGNLFYLKPFYAITNSIKNSLSLSYLFPSQDSVFLSHPYILDSMLNNGLNPDIFNYKNIIRNVSIKKDSSIKKKDKFFTEKKIFIERKQSQAFIPIMDSTLSLSFPVSVDLNNLMDQDSSCLNQIWMKNRIETENDELMLIYYNPNLRKNIVISTISYIDLVLNIFYEKIISFASDLIKKSLGYSYRNTENVNYPKNNILYHQEGFYFIPKRIDYLFVLYIFGILILARKIAVLSIFGSKTSKSIFRKLVFLNELIDSKLTLESGKNVTISERNISLNIFAKKMRNFEIANEKDIEKHLLEILDDSQKPGFLSKRSRFIFIFDELDKIESTKKNEKEINKEVDYLSIFSPEKIRERQQAILALFSSLKYFLSTAKAKFIFIAGREIYDAALADISDRNYFIGSIFHEVINVESFYSDELDFSVGDIASMTEHYICKLLLPEKFISSDEDLTLKNYNKFLLENVIDFKLKRDSTELDNKLAKEKREKIIFLLSQFIIYLTHVSNGAPKKITSYFERHIQETSKIEIKKRIRNQDSLFVRYHRNNRYFLVFDYHTQYKISIVNYLVNPIIASNISIPKKLDDKLLVSNSFLIDHMFKFHKNSFSWRNIELFPEIVDVNKPPELRSFIGNIIQFLRQIHIQEIDSGLFQFKFNKKIAQEIAYLSKISEESSAAFNFILDESLAIKRHFTNLLKKLKTDNGDLYKENNEYINSIASIYMILGDLEYYDEEYNEAILRYMDSIQKLRNLKLENLTESNMMLLVRNMLKLGLTFEKRKTYTSAYQTFGELTKLLIGYRDIRLEKLGLEIKLGDNKEIIVYQKSRDQDDKYKYNENLPRNLWPDDKIYSEGTAFLERISRKITPDNYNVIFKISSFEGIRMLYQPILAKLQIIEKSHIGGITESDFQRMEKEFEFLIKTINVNEKNMLTAEFWSKAGDILYYKNGINNSVQNDPSDCCSRKKELQEIICNIPCKACYCYFKSINFLLKFKFDSLNECSNLIDKNKKVFKELNSFLVDKKYQSVNSQYFSILAKILSNLGDIQFSCLKKIIEKNINNDTIKFDVFILDYLDLFEFKSKNEKFIRINDLVIRIEFNIQSILMYYYYSYMFYKKSSEHKEAAYQLVKVLHLFKIMLKSIPTCLFKNIEYLPKKIENTIFRNIVNTLSRSYGFYYSYDFYKNRGLFNFDNHKSEGVSMKNLFLKSDVTEAVILLQDIKLVCDEKIRDSKTSSNKEKSNPVLVEAIKYNYISPYSLNDHIYNRILKLQFKASLHYSIIKNIIPFKMPTKYGNLNEKNIDKLKNELKDKFKSVTEDGNVKLNEYFLFKENNPPNYDQFKPITNQDVLEYFIVDSIFCFNEIITLYSVYGKSFMLNHTFIGSIRKKLMRWCFYYECYIDLFKNSPNKDWIFETKIEEKLKQKIEKEHIHFINFKYQGEKAVEEYYKAIETHTEGKEYKNLIENMYFLNDDFNDRITHFMIAFERYKIYNNKIYDEIERVRIFVQHSNLYRHENHLKTYIHEDEKKDKEK